MKNFFKARSRWFTVSLVLLLITGIAVAAIIATARIDSNTVATPLIEGPPSALAVVLEPTIGDCATSAGYEEISSAALFVGQALDYTQPQGLLAANSAVICLKNQSPDTPMSVTLGFGNVASAEVGACDPDEALVPDATCLDGEPGELASGELTLGLFATGGVGACSNAAVAIESAAGVDVVAVLDVGEWCSFDAFITDTIVDGGGFPDPVYSSDSLSFDFVFSADDGVVLTAFYPDADGDGYGDSGAAALMQVDAPPGYVIDNSDCDDTNGLVNPGATEINGNGVDEDCDAVLG